MLTRKYRIYFFLLASVCFLSFSTPAPAEMICMSDQELEGVVGSGPIDFSITGNKARIEFNFPITTFTDIESIKLGYHDNNGLPLGWDQDWTNVTLGSSTQELVVNGIYVEMFYQQIDNSATRTLRSVRIGTEHATGTISALFQSFSGLIDTGTGIISGMRIVPDFSEIALNHSRAFLEVRFYDENLGYNVHLTNATVN